MRYMAPEVFQDNPHYDEKVDIYSCGLIMWYMALGERPFDRVPAQVVAEKAASSDLRPSVEPLRAVCGAELTALVERTWAKQPALRPSASDMVDELEELQKQLKAARKGKCVVS